MMLYSIYKSDPFGTVRIAGEVEAESDQEALKQARVILPDGAGELRQSMRVVCRFGRSSGFLLQK